MTPWFERWPDLERWELERFAARELPAEVDETERAAGRLVVHSELDAEGDIVPLVVRYPAEYPELPPLVFGPVGLLERHQQPFDGNFCLLENPFDDWNAAEWGAADLIAERLAALFADTAAGPEALRAAEAPMPEPYSAYFHYPIGPTVLMSGHLSSPSGDEGTMSLRIWDPQTLRLVVETVDGEAADQRLLALTPTQQPLVHGRWRRVSERPAGPDASALLAWLRDHHPDLVPRVVPPRLRGNPRIRVPALQVAALVFKEERHKVGAEHDGWLFLGLHSGDQPVIFHHQLVSEEERQRRAPSVAALSGKRVLVVGAGTLGGDIAVQLARAGLGSLDLIDFDRYEFGNTIRHVLPLDAVGLAKGDATMIAAQRANPFCDVRSHHLLLGSAQFQVSPLAVLEGLVDACDLVVDATGAQQLTTLISRVAAEHRTPMVSAGMTNGYWGADIIRIIPGSTCCYVCYAKRQREGGVLKPDEGAEPPVAAQGCMHPAIVGAGFDAAEVAAIATRLAVQTLLEGDGYPDSNWDHAALSFRRATEDPERPRFATESLSPSASCETCQAAAGLLTTP